MLNAIDNYDVAAVRGLLAPPGQVPPPRSSVQRAAAACIPDSSYTAREARQRALLLCNAAVHSPVAHALPVFRRCEQDEQLLLHALLHAVRSGHTGCAEAVLDAGADVNDVITEQVR